jgi:hypothetical protein
MRSIRAFFLAAFLLGPQAAPVAVTITSVAWVLTLPTDANGTILLAAGEDLDVTPTGAVTTDTTSGHFRSGWARAALSNTGQNSATDPATVRFDTPTVANQTTLWVHAEVFSSSTGTIANNQSIVLFGSDGVRRLVVRGGPSQNVKISTRNTAGTLTDLVTCTASSWPVGGLSKLDWFTNYAVAGHTTLYVNGVSVCDYAGDVTTNSVTAVNQVEFGESTGIAQTNSWSEIVLSTTDTRDMNLFTCAPTGAGNTQSWTGSFANVNPTTINDPSAITTGSTSALAEFTCAALPSGAFTVPAVVSSIRDQVGSTGPQNFRPTVRPSSGSTTYDFGADTLGATSFTSYPNFIWSTNPATSTSWTTGDLGTGFNLGIKARP